jgi:hypothetical protein
MLHAENEIRMCTMHAKIIPTVAATMPSTSPTIPMPTLPTPTYFYPADMI